MALIDITPVMTSNTTPSPYVVSASSEHSDKYSAWKALSGGRWNSCADEHENSWLQIDFGLGNEKEIDEFSLSSLPSIESTYPCWANNFSFEGSDDASSWNVLGEYVVDNWDGEETKVFSIVKNKKAYRYYRFYIKSTNSINTSGNFYAYLYNIRFYKNLSNVNHKNASFTYQLPMNTTQAILAKTNDSREGLLGMANDTENYGDLYVVGKDGKSHLTKSGIKTDVLFDGSANEIGEYILSHTVEKYKELRLFYCNEYTGYDSHWGITLNIPVEIIEYGKSQQFRCQSNGENIRDFSFINGTTLKIDRVLGATTVKITKIIGIY